jgi:hypothetical protein
MGGRKSPGSGPRRKGPAEGAGRSLVERYRTVLVDRLTAEDLEELQLSLRNQFDERGNLVRENREKFEWKLRRFLHEEVLTREIAGIEALIRDLRPSDLKK